MSSTSEDINRRSFLQMRMSAVAFLGVLLLGLPACQSDSETDAEDDVSAPPVVEVKALDYAFAAPDSIPSGWVTVRMENRGKESHHLRLDRLPDDRSYKEFRRVHLAPRDSLVQLLAAGKIDTSKFVRALEQIPEWAQIGNLEKRGGVGLVTPGRTGQATFKLKPGTYFMYCVIGAPNGRVHASLGMKGPIVVTEAAAGEPAVSSSSVAIRSSPLEPDAWVKSSGRELRTEGSLLPGLRTVGFRAEELPEGLSGEIEGAYSVWLARIEEKTDADTLLQWEWDEQNPAPTEFLGGFEYVPPSDTAYMTADLTAGRYAWIWFYYGESYPEEDKPIAKAFTVE